MGDVFQHSWRYTAWVRSLHATAALACSLLLGGVVTRSAPLVALAVACGPVFFHLLMKCQDVATAERKAWRDERDGRSPPASRPQ